MYDIIIKNGTLIDGSGEPMYRADIGIKDDRIVKIGKLQNEKGEIEIDASDRLVCPGFVDVNNHSDVYWRIFSNPELESLVYQGITTIVGGNCGTSLAPLLGAKAIESLQKWSNIDTTSLNWLTMEEFLDEVEKRKLAVNFATLVGHATVRRRLVGDDMRSLHLNEIDFLAKKIKVAIKDGALGMSSGLVYTHARSTTEEELLALAKVIKKYDGVYVTHMRNEGAGLLESVEESLEIARKTKVKLHISHLKAVGEENWGLMDAALNMITQARDNGVDVTFDVYPYTNIGSVLYTLLPIWVTDGGKKMMLNRLKDPALRVRIIDDMRASGVDYAKIEIASSSLDKTLARRKIAEIAASQEKSVEEAVLDTLVASDGRMIISMDVLSEENIQKALVHPASMISTNGAGYRDIHGRTGEVVHPRSFGSFPRIFPEYVLGKRILRWEEAVAKMTSLPAEKFGIEKRGRLKEKYYADIVIFNRDEIRDLATTENPYQYSQGIDFVLVNGQVLLQEGRYNGNKAGEVIRR